jgi:hypothetical protein
MRSSRASSLSTSISNVRPSSSELNIGDTILVRREILGKLDNYQATIIDIKDVQADFLEKQYAGGCCIIPPRNLKHEKCYFLTFGYLNFKLFFYILSKFLMHNNFRGYRDQNRGCYWRRFSKYFLN